MISSFVPFAAAPQKTDAERRGITPEEQAEMDAYFASGEADKDFVREWMSRNFLAAVQLLVDIDRPFLSDMIEYGFPTPTKQKREYQMVDPTLPVETFEDCPF